MKVLVTQLCLTLCDPMDCSPPGYSVHGILQARILGCIVIPFSFFFSLWTHLKNDGKMYLHHMWGKERSIFVVEVLLLQEPKGLTRGRHLCHPRKVH